MIAVTKLNGQRFVVNAELIRFVETTPDTLITLSSGDKFMVKEALDDVVKLAMDYHRQIRMFNT